VAAAGALAAGALTANIDPIPGKLLVDDPTDVR
jgi:hypothetical protein